jgi:hypothetical protein
MMHQHDDDGVLTAEVVEDEAMAIELRPPSGLFGTASPEQVLARAAETASVLKDVVINRRLVMQISGKQHVLVEGWTLLGSMLGVFPVVVWTRPLEDGTGWEAKVEARTLDGNVVGSGEAMCSRDEGKPWNTRDENAIRAMAQTRATSRALRGPLGFIVHLAGYQAAAAEEMPYNVGGGSTAPQGDLSTSPEPSTTRRAVTGDQPGPPPTNPPSKLSESQQRNLHAIGKRKGLTHQDLHDIAGRDFSVESMNELTKHQASEMAKMLNTYPDVEGDPVVAGREATDG